jgi:ADP-heptose:LPS heptosyltransferase
LDITLALPKYFCSIAKRSLPKSRKLKILNFDECATLSQQIPIKSFQHTGFYNNLSTHLTDHAFRIITSQEVDAKYKNYLPIKTSGVSVKRFNLPEKYVVISTGFTAKVREFRPEVVNEIIDYVNSRGYTPVFLGKKETYAGNGFAIQGEFSDEIRFEAGLDLRDQTTLLESVLVIKNSAGIVGLDNGLLHLAATTDVPIIGGFTSVKPEHRLPYRNDEMGWNYHVVTLESSELECIHCQSNNTLTIKHPNKDFRYCLYDDYKCTEMLTAKKYVEKLDLILES